MVGQVHAVAGLTTNPVPCRSMIIYAIHIEKSWGYRFVDLLHIAGDCS